MTSSPGSGVEVRIADGIRTGNTRCGSVSIKCESQDFSKLTLFLKIEKKVLNCCFAFFNETI